MCGQNHHFSQYAPEKIAYAINRYVNETNRLYGVLNKRLEGRTFICGDDYTIADMMSYPWIVPHERQGQKLEDFPHLKRWRSEEHTSELQSLMRISYAVFCLKKKITESINNNR